MSKTPARGFAPGKLILSGEHAVVHGHRAIATAVDRGTTVLLHPRPGPTRIERADIESPLLPRVLAAVLPEEGLGVEIHSTLPVGRGMGSSAALAVALLRARAALQGQEPAFEDLHKDGFVIERIFHGNPSGVDHAVSALGTGVSYRRTPEGPVIEPLSLPRLRLVVLDSGRAGDTGQMVAGVAARRPAIDPILDEIGALTNEVLGMLKAELRLPELGALLTLNHRLLGRIGVSTDALDALVRLALDAGAHGAKLAGAGGGGVVIALVEETGPLLQAAGRAGIPAFAVSTG